MLYQQQLHGIDHVQPRVQARVGEEHRQQHQHEADREQRGARAVRVVQSPLEARVADVYGEEYPAIGFICPGMREDKVKEAQIDTENITFEDGAVPEGKSYAVAISQSAKPFIEELDPEKVEVCEMIDMQIKAMEQQGQSLDGGVPMIQGTQPLGFQREDGTWKMVA